MKKIMIDIFSYHGMDLKAMTRQRGSRGFSLIELLSVIAIIGILCAIAIPAYSAYIRKVKIDRAIVEIRTLQNEIAIYKTNNGNLPESLTDIGFGGLKDPWGYPYEYLKIEGADINGKGKLRRDQFMNPLNSDYDLYSIGPDGDTATNLNAKNSRDDIVRANSGAFIGIAADF